MKTLDYKHVVERLHAVAAQETTPRAAPETRAKKPAAGPVRSSKEQLHVDIIERLDTLQKHSANKPEGEAATASAKQERKKMLSELSDLVRRADLAHGKRPASITQKFDLLGRIDAMSKDIDRSEDFHVTGGLEKQKQASIYARLYAPAGGLSPVGKAFDNLATARAALGRQKKTLQSDGYKGLIPAGGPQTTAEISRQNLQILAREFGAVRPEEQVVFDCLTQEPLYFKHATDSFARVSHSGRLMSPELGAVNNGTSVKNGPFDHGGYIFGRLELKAGPASSRFGGATIEIPYDLLPAETGIILRDQLMPFATLPRALHERPKDASSTLLRAFTERANHTWDVAYPDSPNTGVKQSGIVNDLFVGRDACRQALAMHLLIELRRMAGVGTSDASEDPTRAGATFRAKVLQGGAALDEAFTQLVRPQILVPGELDLNLRDRALKGFVYNAAGSGVHLHGHVDEHMKDLNATWNGQEKNLSGSKPTVDKTLVKRLDYLDAHLKSVNDAVGGGPRAAPKKAAKARPAKGALGKATLHKVDIDAAFTSFEILCTWQGRLEKLLKKDGLAKSPARDKAAEKLQEIEHAIQSFGTSQHAAGKDITPQGKSFVVKRRLSHPSEVLAAEA